MVLVLASMWRNTGLQLLHAAWIASMVVCEQLCYVT